jgi:hypothetical protein
MTPISIPRRQLTLVLGAASVLASPFVRAQAWPAKPIRLIVPFALAAPARWWRAASAMS